MAAVFTHQSKRLILAFLTLAALPILYYGIPVGQDWIEFFRPATLALLRGQNPYHTRGFHNAPWTLIPFIPFALMPYQLGRVGLFLLSLACFIYIAYQLGAKPVSMILFITSYPVISCLNGGGIDWLPMLSFVLPAPIGLIFAVMKPQIGLGISLYWLVDSWRTGGLRRVLRAFLPVTLLLVASFLLYGLWFTQFPNVIYAPWNVSLFPYELPIGLYLLWTGLNQKRERLAMASSPFLSPYQTLFSLSGPLVALFAHPKLLAVASACLWTYGVLRVLVLD